ncbi:MAG: hypothetical protein ACM3O3_09745 [Syntrophothermus sp.]
MVNIEDLKVGTKVKLRDDLKDGRFYNGVLFKDNCMKKGVVVTITEVATTIENKITCFYIDVDGDIVRCCYTAEMVEKIIEDDKYVKCVNNTEWENELTIGKIYKVNAINGNKVSFISNIGTSCKCYAFRFEPVDIEKEIKIEIANREKYIRYKKEGQEIYKVDSEDDDWYYCTRKKGRSSFNKLYFTEVDIIAEIAVEKEVMEKELKLRELQEVDYISQKKEITLEQRKILIEDSKNNGGYYVPSEIADKLKQTEIKHAKETFDNAFNTKVEKFEDIPHLAKVYKRFNAFIYHEPSKTLLSPFGEEFRNIPFEDIFKIEDFDGSVIYEKPEWKEIDYNELFAIKEPVKIRITKNKKEYEIIFCATCQDCCPECKFYNDDESCDCIEDGSTIECIIADKIEVEI